MVSQVSQQLPCVDLPNFATVDSLCTKIDMSPNHVQTAGYVPMEERVAIIGGSFDPITNGHVLVGCEIIHSGKADAVWLVPCGKADALRERHGKLQLNIPYMHRLTMCHLAIDCTVGAKFPMQVCDVECIGELKRRYPEKTFSLVCGSEMLPSLLWWFEGEDQTRFLQNDFLIIERHGYELEKQMAKSKWPDWVKHKGIAEWPVGFDGGKLPTNFSMLDKSGIGKDLVSLKLRSLEVLNRMKSSAEMAEGLIPAPVLNHMIRYNLHNKVKDDQRHDNDAAQRALQAEPTWEESALKSLMAEIAPVRDHRVGDLLLNLVVATMFIACFVIVIIFWNSSVVDETKEAGQITNKKPAPDWFFSTGLLGGMIAATILWGLILMSSTSVGQMRGALEYTTMMMMDLKKNRCYKYSKINNKYGVDSMAILMYRELHQLRVEANLAGWSDARLAEQLDCVRSAYAAKDAKKNVMQKQALKLAYMVKNTILAMPMLLAIVNVIFAVATVGVGAAGLFLMLTVVHMPNPDTDELWIEISWQTINTIFTILAIWKGPGRVKLMYHLLRHDYEHDVEGDSKSLIIPGVLLSRQQVLKIAAMRLVNIACQYVVSFFMWAWLPRCLQEEKKLNRACKSRPPWGVPLFLVMGLGIDIASNAAMHGMIVECEYIKWPNAEPLEAVLTLETQAIDNALRNLKGSAIPNSVVELQDMSRAAPVFSDPVFQW